jgi:hypothetical protein
MHAAKPSVSALRSNWRGDFVNTPGQKGWGVLAGFPSTQLQQVEACAGWVTLAVAGSWCCARAFFATARFGTSATLADACYWLLTNMGRAAQVS